MIRAITTVGYIGLLRPAPGTWGSAAAVLAGLVLDRVAGFPGLLLATVAVTALGFWACARALAGRPGEDPAEIVIDEVAGQWIALLPVVFGAAARDADLLALWPGWVAAFVLFRLFDITKWGPIGWADRMHGPTGVMLDDVIAGVFAAIGVVALAALFHLVLL